MIWQILGFICAIIGIIFAFLGQTWVKTRIIIFRDLSMIRQYIYGVIFLLLAVFFFYLGGSFQ